MYKVAEKYRLRLEALAILREIIRNMLMWDHIIANKRPLRIVMMRSGALKCLTEKHKA